MNRKNKSLLIIGIIIGIACILIILVPKKSVQIKTLENESIHSEQKELTLDDKLKRLKNKNEIIYQKNQKGENLFSNEISRLIYPEKDKEIDILLNKINNIFNKIYEKEAGADYFSDIEPNDPILEGLFLNLSIKIESINKDTVVFRIEEEGHLGATGMYGNYYYTFNKKNLEQVKLDKKEKYIEDVVEEINKKGNFYLLEKSKNEIEDEMYCDGNWYLLDNKVVFILVQDGVNPPLYIEVEK